MTDRQLKSLSKVQMLEILHEQEKEIERLTAELDKPRANAETVLLGEIVQAAQDAADSYLKNIQNVEDEKINGIAMLENKARRRYDEAERYAEDAANTAGKTLTDMNNVFTELKKLFQSMHEDFIKELSTTSLKGLLPAESVDAVLQAESNGAVLPEEPEATIQIDPSPSAQDASERMDTVDTAWLQDIKNYETV